MKRTICILLCLLGCLIGNAQTGLRLKTIVIDPGHGGKDPGAVSKDKNNYEKTFTLDISKRLAAKIQAAYPDVKVVLTRTGDTFPELQQRAKTANDANADLFISIHINSTAGNTANGYSVHVMGQSSDKNKDLYTQNMEICKRENSVIMLEEDYKQNYQGFDPNDPASYIFMQLMQNSNLEKSIQFAQQIDDQMRGGPIKNDRGVSQNPFLVLWMTSMPAVLVEVGFLSNTTDLDALKSAQKRGDIAERLFKAVCKYKESYEGVPSVQAPAAKPEPKQEVKAEPKVEAKPEAKAEPEPQPQKEAAPAPVVQNPTPNLFPSQKKQEEPKEEVKPATPQPQKEKVVYGVQVVATSKTLDPKSSLFMGYTPRVVKVGTINKYVIAISEDIAEVKKALPQIRKKVPDCFIVKIEEESNISIYK